MTLAQIQAQIYRRTKTNATSFTDTEMLPMLNTAYQRANTIIRTWLHNYYPTEWTAGVLTTGTAEPAFEAAFHDLIPLWVSYEKLLEDNAPNAAGIWAQIVAKEDEMRKFYGLRNYQIFTVTIASPGVFTKYGHGLLDDDQIVLETTSALPTGLTARTTYYYVINSSDDTFQVATTQGGTAVNTSGTQSGTHYFSLMSQRNKRFVPGKDSNK